MSTVEDRARSAAEQIVKDLEGRSGGDAFWDEIDPDIQEEIMEGWTTIIVREMSAP